MVVTNGLTQSKVGFLPLALSIQQNPQVDSGFCVLWVNHQHLVVALLGLVEIADLLVDDAHVEQSDCISFLVDGDLKVVDGSLCVFALVVKEDADVEIGFKVLRVCI